VKKRFVIHPFLFGVFFVLALYSANVTEVSFTQVLPPLLFVVGCVAAILLLAWLLLRDARKAALLTSIEVILCLSYGHAVDLFNAQPTIWFMSQATSPSATRILLVWTVFLGISVYFIYWYWKKRWNQNLDRLTTLFNIVGAVLIIMPVVTIVVHEARGSGHYVPASDGSDLQLSAPVKPPDIYYIILDAYASPGTLEERFGFGNSEFLDYLSGKGFYVASQSHSNYLTTIQSLSSSLNMDYLGVLASETEGTAPHHSVLRDLLENNRVMRILKTSGYEFINIGSWWEVTRENKHADVNINYGGNLSEFSRLLLTTSAVDPVGSEVLGLWGDERRTQYERVKYEFDWLSQVPEREGPTFVFAHFTVPHSDYVFKSDGDFLSVEEAGKRSLETRYLDQLVAVNAMAEQCIDRLITASDVPPIIILQSDHGPPPDLGDEDAWVRDTSDADLRCRSGILNVYYLLGADPGILYPSISPVNSFRLVFNLCFGTNLELLADKTYGQPTGRGFVDVTERVQEVAG
jgi:hypothetical protein